MIVNYIGRPVWGWASMPHIPSNHPFPQEKLGFNWPLAPLNDAGTQEIMNMNQANRFAFIHDKYAGYLAFVEEAQGF